MLNATGVAVRGAVLDRVLWDSATSALGSFIAQPTVIGHRAERDSWTRDIAPAMPRDVVRLVAAITIGLNIALSVIDVWRIAYWPLPPDAARYAAMAAAFAIPLHIRHVVFGLRGERPPAGAWTLAVLAVIHVVALQLVGQVWIFQLASLAVSTLIVAPGVWGVPAAAAILASPLALVGTQWYAPGPIMPAGIYLMFALTWRTVTQVVPIRLLSAIRALDTAGRELEARALVEARVRIDRELRAGVAGALQHIVAVGEGAQSMVGIDAARAGADVKSLTGESRKALTDARRLVARYRGGSSRAEVDAVLQNWGTELRS
jgi:hypothetical protein